MNTVKLSIYNEIMDSFTENQELKETINEYIKMRIAKRAKPTTRALELIFKKLSKYNDDIKIKMLEQSIIGSWTDVYELKQEKTSTEKSSFQKQIDTCNSWLAKREGHNVN